MKKPTPQAKRKRLEKKVMQIFREEMKRLSEDLQTILADDLVTAFINRMAVFTQIQSEARVSNLKKRTRNP